MNCKTILLINYKAKNRVSYYNPTTSDVIIDFEQITSELQKNDYFKYPPNELLVNFYIQQALNRFFNNKIMNRCFLIIKNVNNTDVIINNLKSVALNHKLDVKLILG